MQPLTPHGPGFRFVQEFFLEAPGKATASMRFDPELWFFKAHFPEQPLVPAVLLIEAAAQAAGILWMHGSEPGTPLFLASIDQFRVIGPVTPGQTLDTAVTLLKELGTVAQFEVEARVAETPVARGRLTLSRRLG